uniref:Transcription factor CBF/NF-Y/archaeal histone domain-containing protein n=1 Tax=Salix viminalis TaxID=40686 RepID=A0A6N2K165_SALVM
MADSDNESGGQNNSNTNESSPREQDRLLPIANLMQRMQCVESSASSGERDKCQREKRKTINGDDLLWAMTTLGFEDYVEPLKIYLQKFREMEGEKTAAMGIVRQGDSRDGGGGGGGDGSVVNSGNSGGGFGGSGGDMYVGMQPSMAMMGHHHYHHHHQGNMYGSGSGASSGRPR